MNLAHLHLVMNHVPTVGSVAALGLLLLGYVRRNDHLKHVGLEVLFVIALLTLPVYVSGVAAHFEIRDRPGVVDNAIKLHQDVALFGFMWMEFAGFIAWVTLWMWRRHGRPARGLVPAATLLLLMALVVMGRAANLGGEIRHPEILDAGAAPAAAALGSASDQFVTSAITQVAVYSHWAWPAAETIHFLGLSLSFGVLLFINLRLLGVMKQVPFADIHRLLPWGMLGFGANLITGMFFFVGQPAQYTSSVPFYWKLAFLMIAGANFLYLTVFGKAWDVEGGDGRTVGSTARFEPNLADKAMAILSLTAWLGVLYGGRMLPFLGKSF